MQSFWWHHFATVYDYFLGLLTFIGANQDFHTDKPGVSYDETPFPGKGTTGTRIVTGKKNERNFCNKGLFNWKEFRIFAVAKQDISKNNENMKRYINILCVLILALTLVDLISTFFLSSGDVSTSVDPKSVSLGTALFVLFVLLLALCAIVVAFVCFIKFILNVNRNEVFTQKNISLLRKYGVCALACGVCVACVSVIIGIEPGVAVSDSLDALGEGLFALLMSEVFVIGLNMQEGKNVAV